METDAAFSADQEVSDSQICVQTDFFPGSVHQEAVRDFWRTELKAGTWVMDLLQDGYIIPFVKPPTVYAEPSQDVQNARDDSSSNEEELLLWLDSLEESLSDEEELLLWFDPLDCLRNCISLLLEQEGGFENKLRI